MIMFENRVVYVDVEVERERWEKEVIVFPKELALGAFLVTRNEISEV